MVSDSLLRRLIRSEYAVALLGDLIRAIIGTLVAVLIAAWIGYYSILAPIVFTRFHMNDFGKFYYSTQMYLDGQGMYGPSPATASPVGSAETREFWNMNPPHFHLVIVPLAKLPELPAFALWACANLAALGLSIIMIWRELALRWTASRAIWAVFLGVVWSATGATVVTGQLTFLLTLGITIAWQGARRGRWTNAGIWLGVLASIKPFLGVFWLYFLVTRRFKPAAAMAGSGLICFAIGLAVFGWTAHLDWLRALGSVTWAWATMNASVGGLVARTLDASPLFQPVYYAPSLVLMLSWLGAASIALVTFRDLMRTDDEKRTDRAFLLLLLMAQLVAPLGWIYYSWIAVGPMLAWWPTQGRSYRSTALLVLALPGFICPVPFTVTWAAGAWAAPTVGSVYFWMVFSVWCAVIFRSTRAAPAMSRSGVRASSVLGERE